MPTSAACCRLRLGGPWRRHKDASGFQGASLDREHRRLHGVSRQTHPEYLGEMSVQDNSQRRVGLVLGSAILAILSSPAIVIVCKVSESSTPTHVDRHQHGAARPRGRVVMITVDRAGRRRVLTPQHRQSGRRRCAWLSISPDYRRGRKCRRAEAPCRIPRGCGYGCKSSEQWWSRRSYCLSAQRAARAAQL